jgi:hypothetical protein
MIRSSFVAPRPPGRDDPARFAFDRTGDRDLAPFDDPEDLIPDLAITIRSTDDSRPVEYAFHICKVDAVDAEIARPFSSEPTERPDIREQLSN